MSQQGNREGEGWRRRRRRTCSNRTQRNGMRRRKRRSERELYVRKGKREGDRSDMMQWNGEGERRGGGEGKEGGAKGEVVK